MKDMQGLLSAHADLIRGFQDLMGRYLESAPENAWDAAREDASEQESEHEEAVALDEHQAEEPWDSPMEDEMEGGLAADGCYSEEDIDLDDPRFLSGRSLGIPYSVYLYSGFGRGPVDTLLPIDGLFHEPYGYNPFQPGG